MIINKRKIFLYKLIYFSNFIFEKKWVYFLNKNLFSSYLLNLTFQNDRLFNIWSNKTNLD